jgi:DNA-directed RNA polymerase specialized sigma24 family protein
MVRLHEHAPRLAALAELRFFGGISLREAASVLGVSLTTAKNEWALARAWLTKLVREAEGTRGA